MTAIAQTDPDTLEHLERQLLSLRLERERLHDRGTDPVALDHNRQAIVSTQWQIAHALGASSARA